jgi:pimeloyl-ACP methyl ester carboxylesterase
MQTHHADTLRESVVSVLGAPPDPAPLQPEVLDIVAGDGFRREHIKYQVSPGDWSYAYLLIPNTLRAQTPAIYCHHRQSGGFKIGKSEIVGDEGDKEHAIGLELVKRGYVVFAPDAIGFGERRSPGSDGDGYDLAYNFHLFALRLLRGETLLRKVIWDVSRGIDYLETRSEVDSRFIGFVGYGYGGRMALWATAMEPRIKAAVAHCGVITYREHIKRGDWFQVEFVVPRLMQVADVHHILSLIAPRPFLLSTTDGDDQSADAIEIYQKTLPIYEKQGTANRMALYRYRGAQAFAPHMRTNAYNWLDSWLSLDTALPGRSQL